MEKVKLLCGLLLALASVTSQATIVVGQSVPLSGTQAEYGKHLAQGARVYFAWLNEKEGGVNGEQIKLVSVDDGGERLRAISNTRKLIDRDGVQALLAYADADAVQEVQKLGWLQEEQLALVGVAGGARASRELPSPNVFQVRAGQRDEIQKLIAQMKGLGIVRAGVFYQDDQPSREGLQVAQDAARELGVKMAETATFPQGGEQVAAAAKKLAQANLSAVLMISSTRPAGAFIRQFRAEGGNAMLYTTSNLNAEQLVKDIGAPLARGLAMAQVLPLTTDEHSKLIREFRSAISKYALASISPNGVALEGYLAARLLTEALRKAGKQPSRERVYQALTGLGEVNLGGYKLFYDDKQRGGSRFAELSIINQEGMLSR